MKRKNLLYSEAMEAAVEAIRCAPPVDHKSHPELVVQRQRLTMAKEMLDSVLTLEAMVNDLRIKSQRNADEAWMRIRLIEQELGISREEDREVTDDEHEGGVPA